MSFYGSVYYQLIDTFYKIIVKNTGNENTTNFPEIDFNINGTAENEIIESPAVGRKGIFSDSRIGFDMFTLTCPLSIICGVIIPARVFTVNSFLLTIPLS